MPHVNSDPKQVKMQEEVSLNRPLLEQPSRVESYLVTITRLFSESLKEQSESTILARSSFSRSQLSQMRAYNDQSETIKANGKTNFWGQMGVTLLSTLVQARFGEGASRIASTFGSSIQTAFLGAPGEARANQGQGQISLAGTKAHIEQGHLQQAEQTSSQLSQMSIQVLRGLSAG